MSGDERFAAYTRSSAFALTLSAPQIDFLLCRAKTAELEAKYPWYGADITFGTADELAVQMCTSTVRALTRKGLVDVTPTEPPCRASDIVRLSPAGLVVVELLKHAGFEVSPRSIAAVPPHPDDRHRIVVGDNFSMSIDRSRGDRRDPVDAPFLSRFPMTQEAPLAGGEGE